MKLTNVALEMLASAARSRQHPQEKTTLGAWVDGLRFLTCAKTSCSALGQYRDKWVVQISRQYITDRLPALLYLEW